MPRGVLGHVIAGWVRVSDEPSSRVAYACSAFPISSSVYCTLMQVAIAGIHMTFIWWPMLSLERAWMFAHLDTWANSHVFRVLSRGEHSYTTQPGLSFTLRTSWFLCITTQFTSTGRCYRLARISTSCLLCRSHRLNHSTSDSQVMCGRASAVPYDSEAKTLLLRT